jgi:hypothetical protein
VLAVEPGYAVVRAPIITGRTRVRRLGFKSVRRAIALECMSLERGSANGGQSAAGLRSRLQIALEALRGAVQLARRATSAANAGSRLGLANECGIDERTRRDRGGCERAARSGHLLYVDAGLYRVATLIEQGAKRRWPSRT